MMRRAIILLALFSAAVTANAQEVTQRDVRVVGIAASEIYIDIGSEAGVAPGDTLRVIEDDVVRAELVVVSVASATSVVRFVDRPLALTRGDRLVVEWRPRDEPVVPDPGEPVPERVSVFDRPAAVGPSPAVRAQPVLTGRIQVGSSAMWSYIQGGSDDAARSFVTPFAGMRARMDGLPAGTFVRVDGRAEYRHGTGAHLARPTVVRFYRASAGIELSTVQVEVGRITDPYDRFAGPIDGIRMHLGDAHRGLALSGGFEPEWRAGGLSSELPRIGAAAHTRFDLDDVRGDAIVLGAHVAPRTDGLVSRTFGGGQLRLDGGAWQASLDALLDSDPAEGTPAFSRLFAQGRVSVVPGLTLAAHAARRRSYVLVGTLQALRPPNDRVGAGVTYTIPDARGLTVRADVSHARTLGTGNTAFTGGVIAPRIPVLDIGFDVYGSMWQHRDRRGAVVSTALSRSIGAAWVSLGHRLLVSEQPLRTLVTHGAEATMQLPVAPRTAWTLQVSGDLSRQLTAAQVYTGLWIRL